VPAFTLVDQAGEPFGSADLRGRVYVASMFFTSCPTLCPVLLEAMSQIQDRYEREAVIRERPVDIQLLSITVDPVNDTPGRLLAKAQEVGADLSRWHFLTGSEADIEHLVVDGFMTAMGPGEGTGEGSGQVDAMAITHSGKVVLVDGEGQIRGYYDVLIVDDQGIRLNDEGVDEVVERSLRVLWEEYE
jgi:protein SCO1/2